MVLSSFPQPPRQALPLPQYLVYVGPDGFLQDREQLVLFWLEGAEPGGGLGKDRGVHCV